MPSSYIQSLINQLYDEGNYDLVIDYTQEPVPSLTLENATWVDEVLKANRLR